MEGFIKSKRGAIGIGTLIIFIALVLVAAVAAAVIINTAGHLQQKASAVGRESVKQVASGIQVIKVVGYANDISNINSNINKLAIIISPNIGDSIDLNSTIVVLSDGDIKMSLVYSGNISHAEKNGTYNIFDDGKAWINDNESKFGVIVLQDDDGSTNNKLHPTINYGDKVVLTVNVGELLGGIPPKKHVFGEVIPEYGASGVIDFITPSTYTTHVIDLQ